MVDVWPKHSLAESDPWARKVESGVKSNTSDLASLRKWSEAQNQGTAASLDALRQQIAGLQEANQYLISLQSAAYAEFPGFISAPAGWYDGGGKASVVIQSPTGRLDIGFGGATSGGDSWFAYSVIGANTSTVYVSRDSFLGNAARYVAVTGGAGFAPSGFKTAIQSVPTTEPLIVTLEVNVADAFVTVAGGSIYARVSP